MVHSSDAGQVNQDAAPGDYSMTDSEWAHVEAICLDIYRRRRPDLLWSMVEEVKVAG